LQVADGGVPVQPPVHSPWHVALQEPWQLDLPSESVPHFATHDPWKDASQPATQFASQVNAGGLASHLASQAGMLQLPVHCAVADALHSPSQLA
jgi:hypothetical protein